MAGSAGARPRCKGVGFRSLLRSLEALRGSDDVRRCVDACPAELRDAIVHGTLLSSGWYPMDWYRELHRAIARTLGTGPEFAHALSHHATTQDLQTVYRVVAVLFSAETLLRQAMRLMGLYFEGPRMTVLELRAGYARLRFDGFVGYDRLCWADLAGGTLAALECARAQEPKPQVVSGGQDGDDAMELALTWRDR